MSRPTPKFENISLERQDEIFILTLHHGPENRLNKTTCKEIIKAFHHIQQTLGPTSSGAVITRGHDEKFFCTGLDLDELDTNPHANTDGFFPMIRTILDFPFPTVALLNGHTFGGGCPFALSHDYRVMNGERGFLSMPPVNLGMHFDGIGTLLKIKLSPQIARKMLLEAHKWTGEEALVDGIVDEIAAPGLMLDAALKLARTWSPKAKMGVYGILRNELYGEATKAFALVSHVHSRETSRRALVKL